LDVVSRRIFSITVPDSSWPEEVGLPVISKIFSVVLLEDREAFVLFHS